MKYVILLSPGLSSSDQGMMTPSTISTPAPGDYLIAPVLDGEVVQWQRNYKHSIPHRQQENNSIRMFSSSRHSLSSDQQSEQ